MCEKNNFYAIIMAGGKGERFWPKSRLSNPKQLLNILGEKTLLEDSISRLTPLIPKENIIIITNRNYVSQISKLLPDVPEENIIGEPIGKDTAPCIALATALVAHKSGKNSNPVMAVMPADHIIGGLQQFALILNESAQVASGSNNIVTIGIPPKEPSTGYGYIKCSTLFQSNTSTKIYRAERFCEKPDLSTAIKFLKDGNYKWNSGMFVFSLNTIIDSFKKYVPEMAEGIQAMLQGAEENNFISSVSSFFESCQKISIDYAVMEKAENILVAESTFEWDDVGSWPALKNHLVPDENGNVAVGKFEQIGSSNCVISSTDSHLIATIGLDNLIIVHTDDVTLVCKEENAQDIKELVHLLKNNPKTEVYI